LFFSLCSLQTVWAFVMRFGTGAGVVVGAVGSVTFADIGCSIMQLRGSTSQLSRKS